MSTEKGKPNRLFRFVIGLLVVVVLVVANVLGYRAANDQQGQLVLTTARIAALKSRFGAAEKKMEEKHRLSFVDSELRRELATNLNSFFSNQQLAGDVPENVFPEDADFVYIHRQFLLDDRTTGAVFLPKNTKQRLVFYLDDASESFSFSAEPLRELKFDLDKPGWTPFAWEIKQERDATQLVFECEDQPKQTFSLPKSVKESEGYGHGFNYYPLNVANRFERGILDGSSIPELLETKWLVWDGVTTYHFKNKKDDSLNSIRIVICLETDEPVDWADLNQLQLSK